MTRSFPPRRSSDLIGGRMSRPRSHYWYIVKDGLPEGTRKWSHPDRRTLVEFRSTGGQTVVAPSIHLDGERYEWADEPWGGEAGPALDRKSTRLNYSH